MIGPARAVPGGGFFTLPETARGRRLDQVLAEMVPGQSRAALQRLLREGRVLVDDRPARAALRVRGGEQVSVDLPPPRPSEVAPEAIPLAVLHEDADLIAIDKPAGMTVHPGAGRRAGTLVAALLHHCRDLSGVGGVERPGIVHRLDRDTSGVLVAAKNDAAHRSLASQFKARTVRKTYEAVVWGRPRSLTGKIDAPIGRHPSARVRMAIDPDGRPSRTTWRVAAALGPLTLLEVTPETGRTHQIRVHLASIGHPVVGDPLYGGARSVPAGTGPAERAAIAAYGGMALHARRLAIVHPATGAPLVLSAPRPEPLERLIADLAGAGGR